MATDFNIVLDSDNTFTYRASLDDTVLTISRQETVSVGMYDSQETVYTPMIVQPWKTLGDGTRTTWSSEAEGITWYKELYT